MGRPKTIGANLPKGVKIVSARGKRYYYFGKTPLGNDPASQEFWTRLTAVMGEPAKGNRPGTFLALIADFKRIDPKWRNYYAEATRRNYEASFNLIVKTAGNRLVSDITARDIVRLRNDLGDTPATANAVLMVLRLLMRFACENAYREDNPFRDPTIEIVDLTTDTEIVQPWPEHVYQYVLAHAPERFRRMAMLGRFTGQRRRDLVEMRAADLDMERRGMWLFIRKRRGEQRDRKYLVPLTRSEMSEILSWGVADLDVFLKTKRGKKFSAKTLENQWCIWKKTETALEGLDVTIHGLRAMKVADMRESGVSDGSIGDEVGMSVAMVSRYATNADKTRAAGLSRDRREKAQVVKLGKRMT